MSGHVRFTMTPDHAFDTEWMDSAACHSLGVSTDLFFPEYQSEESVSYAKAICKGCPVAGKCLQYALEVPIDFGIWGGFTPQERTRFRTPKKRVTPNQIGQG
jgi:WhiB family redox-sensing transcriptional regulator